MSRKSVAPQRRRQIVEALFKCLAEKGHQNITVKDIAKRADLHYGVIHYYFKSKDEIVSALADSLVSKYEGLMLERVQAIDSASGKLQAALDFLVDEFIFNKRLNRVFYNLVQMAFEQKTVRKALRKQLRVYRARIAEVVAEGIETGEFVSHDPVESATLMVAVIEGMALQWMIEPRALDRATGRRLVEEAIDRCIKQA
jgi:AcrR family transcriptional regulator